MVYEYNYPERIQMAFLTGISNFATLPVILLMHIQDRTFELYIGIFTLITSFMYHVCESLDCIIFMEQSKWHILDNIGSICCFNSLIIYCTTNNISKYTKLKLNYLSIFFVITLQIKEPWDLFNTIFPIAVFLCILLFDLARNGIPKFNYMIMNKGLMVLVIAIAMFIKGLDDLNDYLRIAHSLWHISIAISTFYLRQIQEDTHLSFAPVLKRYF